MRNRISKLIILTFCVIVFLGAAHSEATSLRVLTGNWVPDHLTSVFERFQEETGIKVIVEDLSFRELLQTIEIRGKAQDPNVDLIWVDASLVPSYATRGILSSLDDAFTNREIEEIWSDLAIESGYWDDSLWATPMNNSSMVMYYNTDLFDQAGLEIPSVNIEDRWTWEQVAEVASKIVDRDNGVWGLVLDQLHFYYQLQTLPESLGGGPGISEDGFSVKGRLTNDAWLEAFRFYYNTFNTWAISPIGFRDDMTAELFAAGKSGIFVGGPWHLPTFENSGVNFGVAPYPYFANGIPATPTHSWNVGVWNWTQNREAAVSLLKFLTADESVAFEWFQSEKSLPAHNAILEFINNEPMYQEQPYIAFRIGGYEVGNTAVVRARTPAYLEFEEILNDTFEDISNGADPDTALAIAESRIERAIARYR